MMSLMNVVTGRRVLLLAIVCLASVGVFLNLIRISFVSHFVANSSSVIVNWWNPDEDELINAVLTFPLLTDPKWNRMSYRHLTYKEREFRMDEYITSLGNTLAHPRIGSVHCIYDQESLAEYVRERISSPKLQLHFVHDTHLALTLFSFAFKSLHGRLVMVHQADTYPAQGFNNVVGDVMRNQKLFYALTRHGKMEAMCNMTGEFCDIQQYVGSHDAYVFVPQGALSDRHRNILNKKATSWGIDLVIAWVFEDMGYRVLNPCHVIFLYHLHCSWVRDSHRVRVNTDNTTGWFPPTSRLV